MKLFRVEQLTCAILAGVLSASVAMAADEYGSTSRAHPLENIPKPKNWIFFGANLGLTTVSPDSTLLEADKDGLQFDVKALYSHYWNDWVLDLGLGYLINNVSGQDSLNRDWKVRTRSGFAEISPRYRLSENWQLGVVLNGLFGTDVSFDQDELTDTQSFTIAAGPRINYEWGDDEGRWRIGAHVMKDFNISPREVWWYMADIQYGFPISSSDKPYEPVEQAPVEPTPEPTPEPLTVTPADQPARVEAPQFAQAVGTGTVRIYLPEAILRFKTARSDLRPTSYAILGKVAEYLTRYPDAWQKMRVEGHTDIRGGAAYNENLSVNRAKSVGRQLNQQGIPREKMQIRGFGFRKPVDPANDAEAWALNRRVELWLDGVADTAQVTRDLNALNNGQ